MYKRHGAALAVSLCIAISAFADAAVTRLGPLRNAPVTKAAADRPDLAELYYNAPKLSALDLHNLGVLSADERVRLLQPDRPNERALKVGIVRPLGERVGVSGLAAAARENARTGGGLLDHSGSTMIWTAGFRSPGADATRLEIEGSLPAGARAYVYADTGEVYGPYTHQQLAGDTFWTNIIYNDSLYLELQFDAASAPFVNIRVTGVVHMESPAMKANAPVTSLATECFVPEPCVGLGEFEAVAEASDAVAQLSFVKDGSSFVCTGGLLNNTNEDGTPYFLTANHCFNTQASATSLVTTWRYKTTSCSDTNFNPSRSSFPQRVGATLLATNSSSDFTFLRLNQAPPAGSIFLGWDGDTDVSTQVGLKLYRVHHPLGATQFYTREAVTTSGCVASGRPRGNFIYQKDEVGGTAGGSSGSLLYLDDLTVVGQLLGACGPDTSDDCNRSNNSIDGAFRATFPSIDEFLAPGAPTGPGPSVCTPSANVACMLNNRFKVEVKYRGGFDNNAADTAASVKSVSGFAGADSETAFFFFNSASNIEMLIKLLDQGATDAQGNRTVAVLYGLATPLRVEVTITDTTNGTQKKYSSAFGTQAGVTDFTAFRR
ncbi:MAG TPA: hypothetical protein VF824_14685 [Thermoanaerobaculia bacterium]|jgi:hypothetical protein